MNIMKNTQIETKGNLFIQMVAVNTLVIRRTKISIK